MRNPDKNVAGPAGARWVCALLLGLGLLSFPGEARSAPIFTLTEAFNAPLGGIPAGWFRQWASTATGPANGISEIATYGASPEFTGLHQERTDGSAGCSVVYYTGSSGPIVNGVVADFHVSAILRVSGGSSQPRGIAGRAQSTVYNNSSAYWASVTPAGALSLRINPAGHVSHGTLLGDVVQVGSLSATTDYLLTFTAVGSSLSTSLYAWNTGDAAYTTLLGTTSAVDTTYTQGIVGLRHTAGSSNTRVYWRDFELQVIPEPGVAGLAALGAMVFLARRRFTARPS